MGVTHLPLLHFNDVYRVNKQKLQSGETIDATQFAARVDALRAKWPDESGGGGLLLFSGDLFSPSVESSVVNTPAGYCSLCIRVSSVALGRTT